MRNLLIIFGLMAALGVGGFIVAAEITRQNQQPARAAQPPASAPADRAAQLLEASRELNRAVGGAEARGRVAFIAGGISALAGAVCGVVLVALLDRKQKPRASAPPSV